jgi:GTP-binding protein
MVADRSGPATGFALENLQKRGEMFVGIGEAVYEGMVVGESSRPEEMVVNPTRTKELTNIRTHEHDDAVRLTPPRRPTLETGIEWIAEDELVEATPAAIRIRKRYLGESERRLSRKGR